MKLSIYPYLAVLLFLNLISGKVNAQKTEVGVMLGIAGYHGDITNNLQSAYVRGTGGIFLRYHIDQKFAIRGNFLYARVTGADSSDPFSEFQHSRNLSFYTDIIEASAVLEYNLIKDKNKGRRLRSRLIPYVFGGLGFFYYDPWAINPVTGQPIQLRPLQTDGSSYSPLAICVPLGVGMRYYITRNWQIGLELGMRYTSTSHLDDVDGNSVYPNPKDLPSDAARVMYDRSNSPKDPDTGIGYGRPGKIRGKIKYNDIYYIVGVTLSYRLWPSGVRSSGGRAIPCPRFF